MISQEKTITNGKVMIVGDKIRRRRPKRVDYLLRHESGKPLAVVEAKAAYKDPGDGLQQAKDYAELLDLKFTYSTNGHSIIEHDYTNGVEKELQGFPSPSELWNRYLVSDGVVGDEIAEKLLTSSAPMKDVRYYNTVAVNRVIQAILQGRRRMLLTMATGTGKTVAAYQIVWKLWNSRWTSKGASRHPKILYLSDRNILVDDPKDKIFAIFGDARWKIQREAIKSRDIYFATYQSIARDEYRPGLYREYPKDFFDLVIVDECHRGSARDESNWREILEYFEPAYQLGMTATPLREDNKDTYRYFGNPVYTYSLRTGIQDGFLSPYKVYRIISDVDAAGWRPTAGEKDKYGRDIPDALYGTSEFERIIALRARTEAIAMNITDFLKRNDRFAKTIVFCVDMEHAERMRMALSNANADLVKDNPDYVTRVVSDEGDIGRAHLSRFQELETKTPTIVTTSQLLTTGVDIPLCKNVVLVKVIKSMTDFKQTIGRGTRIREDYEKFYFNILDYTGSATTLFADPDFDGEPALLTQEEMDQFGTRKPGSVVTKPLEGEEEGDEPVVVPDDSEPGRTKYYVEGGEVSIVGELVYEYDEHGKRTRVTKYTHYTRDKVRVMYPKAADLRSKWGNPEERAAIIETLEDHGVSLEELMNATKFYDADRFDLLCHVAFNAPLKTRRERAENLRKGKKDFFDQYSPVAREVLNEILDKYIEYGYEQFNMPEILKVPPIDGRGNVMEIANTFGGAEKLRGAVQGLQTLLYSDD